MVKRLTYLSFYLFIYLSSKAQINLVPNPSFEDTIGNNCFAQMNVDNPVSNNHYIKNWCTYKNMTPDYYNYCANFFSGNPYPNYSSVPFSCRTYQLPHTGDAYVGIALYALNYLPDSTNIDLELTVVKLQQPLKANKCYYGEFYVNLANIGKIAINRIGMSLSINTNTLVPFIFNNTIQPQIQWDTTQCFTDTLNWVKISGSFIAQGGEEFLTIGNFRDGAHVKKQFLNTNFNTPCGITNPHSWTYLLIDDVALYELPTPQIQSNAITICPNADTLVLGDTARIETTYQWFANGAPIASTSTISVKPTQTTTYILQSTNCTITSQTIVVTYSNNCEPVVVVEPIIPNVFTPNNDSINDVWRFSLGKGNTLKDISIVNRWGNLLYQKTNNLSQTTLLWDGRTTSGEETPNGVYFYVFQYTDANGDEHKKNGYITLIR
jgi:gliding motility-associated-like protein